MNRMYGIARKFPADQIPFITLLDNQHNSAENNPYMDVRDLALLAGCSLFSGIEPAQLAENLAGRKVSFLHFNTNESILLAGCKYSSIFVLIQGEAWAEMISDEGKIVRVESFKAPEAFATAILFSPDQVLPVSVFAKTDCRVAVLGKDTLIAIAMLHQPVMEALLAETGAKLQFLTEKLRSAQFGTLREKLADWLIRRFELSGSATITTEANRERLAELFGVARPSLSRELGNLAKKNIIAFEGRQIIILDIKALKRLRGGHD